MDIFKASVKNLSIAPSKIRPIANEIRSKSYVDAIAILNSLPNKGALFLSRVLKSAAANALVKDKQLSEENLAIKELLVNEGPRQKRIWARGRGRADRQLKRYAHINVILVKDSEV